ncbi:MAG TPA: Uma2 family endonuclease [Pyrinomonadaceae bacterium]|nr:Uma2 family endonuclease [Pyrinomonadaceae bacterium]
MGSDVKNFMTTADLAAFPDDGNHYELIEGELFVSYPHDLPHQLIRTNVSFAIGQYLEQNPIGIVVPEVGVIFSDYDSVIPDTVFVSRERWDTIVDGEYFVAAPDLVIEIVSSGSENRARDLKIKRKLYGKFGVQEYWAVDLENRSVFIFRLEGKILKEVSLLTNDDRITSPLFPGLDLQLSEVFQLPRELY